MWAARLAIEADSRPQRKHLKLFPLALPCSASIYMYAATSYWGHNT